MKEVQPAFWDYSDLAASYDWRADYSASLLVDTLRGMSLGSSDLVLEVGAGTGKLTAHLIQLKSQIIALEPNSAMRGYALRKNFLTRVSWLAGMGESLPLRSTSISLVAYGSSFNVLSPQRALDECARVLKPRGHWLALWNHRDLQDPLQSAVEQRIRHHLPDYELGARRQSPVQLIERHGAFTKPIFNERKFTVEMKSCDWLAAWSSHATLQRQAGSLLPKILSDIRDVIGTTQVLTLPYSTCLWTAQKK